MRESTAKYYGEVWKADITRDFDTMLNETGVDIERWDNGNNANFDDVQDYMAWACEDSNLKLQLKKRGYNFACNFSNEYDYHIEWETNPIV